MGWGWVGGGVLTSLELKTYVMLDPVDGTSLMGWVGDGWGWQHVNATSTGAGHTLMSDDVKAMVNQWVFRRSLGPITPIAFLEELKLKQVQNEERQKTFSFFY